MPEQQSLDFGAMYSGSPYLGVSGILPPGVGGFNPTAGYMYMWHSHTEKEITQLRHLPGRNDDHAHRRARQYADSVGKGEWK